jgi:hypothetical protein
MVVQIPIEILRKIVSLVSCIYSAGILSDDAQLSRTDQKTLLLVSKGFECLSRSFVDKVIYFPLSGYKWQAKTRREQCARAVRDHALSVIRNPAAAGEVRELCVRSEVSTSYMIPFDEVETQNVARQVEELTQVLANAVNLSIYR